MKNVRRRDFTNMATRAVNSFFLLRGKAQKGIRAILKEKLGEHAPSYATVKNWVAQSKRGDISTCAAPVLDDPKQ
jgi:transposase